MKDFELPSFAEPLIQKEVAVVLFLFLVGGTIAGDFIDPIDNSTEKQLSECREKVEELNNNISLLEEDVRSLERQLNSCSSDKKSLATRLENQNATISDLEDTVANKESKISSLQDKNAELNKEIEALNDQANNTITEKNDQKFELERRFFHILNVENNLSKFLLRIEVSLSLLGLSGIFGFFAKIGRFEYNDKHVSKAIAYSLLVISVATTLATFGVIPQKFELFIVILSAIVTIFFVI